MKDKTHDMNRGFSSEVADAGFEKIPSSEVRTRREYRKFKDEQACLYGPTAARNSSLEIEDVNAPDPDQDIGGFLPRRNYKDRY